MSAIVPFEQQMTLATAFAKCGLFGVKTQDQALALMSLCEAEGLHPSTAVRDYHIINGKPALKADAMMSRFQSAGGKVQWVELNEKTATGVFSHPQGGSVEITWTLAMAEKAGLTRNPTWKSYPRQMLRSRVVSEGIRTVYPGCVAGVYTPEEMQDVEAIERRKPSKPEAKPEPIDMGAAEVVEDDDITDLLNAGNDAAEQGIEPLKAWWASLTKTQRKQVGTSTLEQLKEVAASVVVESEDAGD